MAIKGVNKDILGTILVHILMFLSVSSDKLDHFNKQFKV